MKTFELTKDYNREDFADFILDFFPEDFEPCEDPTYYEFTNIEEGFRLETCSSLGLDIFEFKTKSARDPRVTLTREVVSCMKKYSYSPNALVVFYSAQSHNWRLSLITTEYEISGGKIKPLYSNPRRFSFRLGAECKRHTPESMLFAKGPVSTLEDLKSRFALEVVSKQFFDAYKVFYENFVQFITGNRYVKVGGIYEEKSVGKENAKIFNQFKKLAGGDVPLACKYVRDYVKKFMGRLVFLQFLQKKGWLGVEKRGSWGSGDKNFILNLFTQSTELEKADFLEEVLEPLFFGMLNTNEADREFVFEKHEWDLNLLDRFKKIPYLNGGLFESDALDDLCVKFPKEMFCDFASEGGLLDFFARYNFTIDETDPADMEIGEDPEMLGKIFENLLEDNKDKGAFYTPKEIVQYMCRESLIAYLETDSRSEPSSESSIRSLVTTHNADFSESEKKSLVKKLKAVKVCDPAVGSGAFPMGMLNELYACRVALGEKGDSAEIKKQIVRENIYGVDIEKGAVDIARLRFWLAIIVDEKEPLPLPNLDYKIMQGNSLLECYEGIDLSKMLQNPGQDGLDYNCEERELLASNMKGYFDDNDHESKAEKNGVIKSLVYELVRSTCGVEKNSESDFDLHQKTMEGTSEFFLWHTWFSDVFENGGFDIVIGNPPYIKEYTNKVAFDGFREFSPYYIGKMDLWYGFACHGLDLLRESGVLCFIAQNNWTTSAGAKLMRKKIIENSKIRQMIDFNTYMVFENADIQTMIMLFERNNIDGDYLFDYRTLLADSGRDDMLAVLEKQSTSKTKYLNPNIVRENFHGKLLTFSDNESIFDKIADDKIYLAEHEIAQGIVPNPDVVNSRNIKFLKNSSIKIGEGVFVVERRKFNNLDSAERKYIKPLYEPYQMKRYYLNEHNDKSILYITKSNWKDDAPNLKNHLKKYREIMEQRRENQNGRIEYYHLHWARDEKFFEKGAKILSVRKCFEPTFVYCESATYVMMAVNVIHTTRWNMKFLTGLLNSKLVAFWLKNRGKMQGENYQVDKEPLLGIPLPKAVPENIEKKIIGFVDEIIVAKKNNPDADTAELEYEVDKMVYKLYNLTVEEIKIIEGR